MRQLARHHSLPTGTGLHAVQDEHMRELEFLLARLSAGETIDHELGDREAVLVKLEGPAGSIEIGESRFELPARDSVFTDPPSAVYAPPGSVLRLSGPLLAGIYLAAADPAAAPPAYAVLPDEIASVARGSGNFAREVRDIVPRERPAVRLLVGETLNPPGNWSSAPPHKHDRDAPPEEAQLEEIYLFRVDPTQGFGFQGTYTSEPDARAAFLVRDLEAVTIPSGYHPVVAGPGYRLYYLWGLAGTGRELHWFADPDHSWVDSG